MQDLVASTVEVVDCNRWHTHHLILPYRVLLQWLLKPHNHFVFLHIQLPCLKVNEYFMYMYFVKEWQRKFFYRLNLFLKNQNNKWQCFGAQFINILSQTNLWTWLAKSLKLNNITRPVAVTSWGLKFKSHTIMFQSENPLKLEKFFWYQQSSCSTRSGGGVLASSSLCVSTTFQHWLTHLWTVLFHNHFPITSILPGTEICPIILLQTCTPPHPQILQIKKSTHVFYV